MKYTNYDYIKDYNVKIQLSKLDSVDLEMLELIVLGWTNQQIANKVYLSSNTVRNRISEILHAFNFDNRTQLAIYVDRLHTLQDHISHQSE